jgi:hypothetical protein
VADVGEPSGRQSCTAGRSSKDSAALGDGHQLLEQHRISFWPRMKVKLARPAPAALQLEVDQQNRHAREPADARVERCRSGAHHGRADAG